jgi:hypothetical protein
MIKNKNHFLQLIEALETGWEIEEPILLGAMWRTDDANRSGVYHFVLRQKKVNKTTLLSLPPSPQLLMFLAQNSLRISTR